MNTIKLHTKNKLLTFIIATFALTIGNTQKLEFGASLGGSTYQGDISLYSSRLSFQGAKFMKGIFAGIHASNYLTIKLQYNKAQISGYDSDSVDEIRKMRNLHFKTDINELSLTAEIELLDVLTFFRRYKLKPYITFGVAYFHFNPMGQYNTQWYDLQPLSTEGQGLAGSGTQPYNLSQFSIPFGFGLKYFLNESFFIKAEVSPRITFTDYLDDVSDAYPDFEKLQNYKGKIAVELSYQGNKMVNGIPRDQAQLNLRGNKEDNDWYIFNTLSFGYVFDYTKYRKGKRGFNKGRKCTFFY